MNSEEDSKLRKVSDHNHYTGKYRGAACSHCNLEESKATKKFIPMNFHNLSRYDSLFFVKELVMKIDDDRKIKVLPKSTEEYISFDFGYRVKPGVFFRLLLWYTLFA